ncbi:hypothetical protein B1H10_00815 [candidate division KSB1 bacterium 4484_188]|nr:MAG: hypothetical protein B1H10_00815 [candidate division KSB1 bacterium 4484_188]HFE63076.1 response regulator [Caldithrix sp.]
MSKILVVDDSLTDRKLTNKILKSRHYEVIESDNSESVPDLVEREQPDAIVLDIVMPGVSGYEICRRLKRSPYTRDIPIIFLSGRKDESDIFWGKLQGADEYLAKPVEPQQLLDAVDRLINRNRGVLLHE